MEYIVNLMQTSVWVPWVVAGTVVTLITIYIRMKDLEEIKKNAILNAKSLARIDRDLRSAEQTSRNVDRLDRIEKIVEQTAQIVNKK